MTTEQRTGSIELAGGESASGMLHTVLANAVRDFPQVFSSVSWPADGKAFRSAYPRVLPDFEAARLASGVRGDIAARIVNDLAERIIWREADAEVPLAVALQQEVAPPALACHAFDGAPGWQPSVVYQGRRWQADELAALGDALTARRVITGAAGRAFAWLQSQVLHNGRLDLSGRRIAVLGGGAEMAPTRFWLRAGADVLWIDTVPPPQEWFDDAAMSGRLFWCEAGADLLRQPREVRAMLLTFADGHPVDLGLYAYAPGQARELRLTGVMNALVDSLPESLVGSVTILVSPTTPTELSAEDLSAMQAREAGRPGWEALLTGLGLMARGGCAQRGDAATTRTVVSIQGVSYQAAQYVSKILTAEHWAARGLRVSANTAAITRTRSMTHPVFAAAFGGAAAFGVETMAPRQSRCLNGLLAVHDWLHPERPVPGSLRVHGGIHTLPYPLESALRIAAAIGFARSPRLIRGLVAR